MKDKALVIHENEDKSFDPDTFLTSRNLVAELHGDGASALAAFKNARYRCVVVSMELQREDPLTIIEGLRRVERVLGLTPTQIFVSGKMRQPTQSQIAKYKISGLIRSHRML